MLRQDVDSIIITEGEKKALAIGQLGLAVVGIAGVWSWKKRGTEELIDDLAALVKPGVRFIIVFDYDPKAETRRYTAGASRRLARALRKANGQEVYLIELPAGPGGAKQGADDYLVAHGPAAFQELLGRALPAPVLNDFADLTKPEGRTDANNAARLAAKYEGVARWVGPWNKWLIWDGMRWKLDRLRTIDRNAKGIAADLFVEIAQALRENQE
jgi:hypothetical protein